MATPWRWPPDSLRTSIRTDGTFTLRSAQRRVGLAPHLAHLEEAERTDASRQLAAEEEVLGDVAVVGEGEVLVHGRDAVLLGGGRVGEPDGLALQFEVCRGPG